MNVLQGDVTCNVHIVDQPMLTAAAVVPSVESVVVNGVTAPQRAFASIKRQVALSLMADLVIWRQGDENRFGRMVDGRGAGIGSPDRWLLNLRSICSNHAVLVVYPLLADEVSQGLAVAGLTLPEVR
jgi:hypothetical protein